MTKSLSFKKTSLALAVALSLPVISAQAAESYKAQDVVVTASRVEQQLADVNMSVSVITSEEIEKNSGAKTIADLLESTVPGVRVTNDGGQGLDRVSIRGEGTFRTVVMIDGQRMSEQKSMSGVPLLIDPSQVERIEVIRGPASVLYGSDAIGGAINIITKKGGKKPFEASVSAGFDSSSNGKSASASIFGTHNGWNYRIGASMINNDDLDTPVGELNHTASNTKAADLFLSYDIDPNKTIGFSFNHFDLDYEGTNISTVAPNEFWVEVPKWQRTKGAIFGEFKNLSEQLVRLRLDAYYERNHKEMVNHVYQMAIPAFNVSVLSDNEADNVTNTTSFSAQADWQLGDNHYLITGYEFSNDDLDASSISQGHKPGENTDDFPPVINVPSLKDQDFNGSQTRHAVFATMESSLLTDFIFNYGVRYTWVQSDMDVRTNRLLNNDRFKVGKEKYDSSDGKAVFNLGATWKATENLSLRANWAQGYRYPLLQELYVDTAMGNMEGGIQLANENLKPETSDNFEIGARYGNGVLTLDATVFYTNADDYITAIDINDKDSQMQNVAKAETLGFELDAGINIGNFEPYTTLTLLRREYQENGIKTTKSGTPKVTARYGVRYQREYDGAFFRTDLFAISQSATESHNMSVDKPTITSYGGATTFNLTGGVSFGPENAYSLDAGFYNITDKKYQNNGSTYEAGRHFAVKLNAKF